MPGPRQIAAETMPPNKDPVTQTSSGGDFMVDVLKPLDIEYLAMNCASSFRGLQEAVINYGGNKKPEIITCPHEDIAVHMAQGYAKIEGKPIAMICHGVVGMQHATMAMYNAWCDRVPVIVMGGNIMEAEQARAGRRMGALGGRHRPDRARLHQMGRPAGLAAALRRVGGARLQDCDDAADGAGDDRRSMPSCRRTRSRIARAAHSEARHVIPPQGDAGALAEAAKMLVGGGKPGDHLRSHGAHARRHGRLVELAETLQCAVVDNAGRMNFPSRHPLNQSFRRGVIGQADVILAIEMNDLWGALNAFNDRIVRTFALDLQEGRQARHTRRPRPLPQIQLPGFRPLSRTSISPSRATARPRCRR